MYNFIALKCTMLILHCPPKRYISLRCNSLSSNTSLGCSQCVDAPLSLIDSDIWFNQPPLCNSGAAHVISYMYSLLQVQLKQLGQVFSNKTKASQEKMTLKIKQRRISCKTLITPSHVPLALILLGIPCSCSSNNCLQVT